MTTIATYVHNKTMRHNTTFVVRPDERFYILNGIRIPETEFHATYPVHALLGCKENYDKTREWMTKATTK